jgi:hypothetical protein
MPGAGGALPPLLVWTALRPCLTMPNRSVERPSGTYTVHASPVSVIGVKCNKERPCSRTSSAYQGEPLPPIAILRKNLDVSPHGVAADDADRICIRDFISFLKRCTHSGKQGNEPLQLVSVIAARIASTLCRKVSDVSSSKLTTTCQTRRQHLTRYTLEITKRGRTTQDVTA